GTPVEIRIPHAGSRCHLRILLSAALGQGQKMISPTEARVEAPAGATCDEVLKDDASNRSDARHKNRKQRRRNSDFETVLWAAAPSVSEGRIVSMTLATADPTEIAPSPAALRPDGSPRSYTVRTLGCQMNVH